MVKELGITIQQNSVVALEQRRLEIALSNFPIFLKKELWKSLYDLQKEHDELEKEEKKYKRFLMQNIQKREENYKKISEYRLPKIISKN